MLVTLPSTETLQLVSFVVTLRKTVFAALTASTGVCCHTEHVVHRPRAVAVAQRVCDPKRSCSSFQHNRRKHGFLKMRYVENCDYCICTVNR